MRWVCALILALTAILPPFKGWSASSDPLKTQIEALALQYPTDGVDWGIYIQDLSTGKTIYKKNEALLLNPASNVKILTSLTSLSLLGPGYTFKTQLLGMEGKKKGTLKALVLKGTGDPTLSSERLEGMVKSLKDQGIQGADQIFIDGSYFDSEEFPGQMDGRQRDASFNCNVGAVSIDHNLLDILVSPGEKVGDRVKAEVQPLLAAFPLKVDAITTRKKGRLIVKNDGKNEEDLTVSITGSLDARSGPKNYKISIHHPSNLVALRLIDALQSHGIQVPAQVQSGCPIFKSKILVETQSPPLDQILQEMNKHSDNFIAEQITKNLGAQFSGPPGSTEKGAAVILKTLNGMGINTDGIKLENGSGLSKKTRVTSQALAQVLQRAYEDPKLRLPFFSSLSVMGVDGTLRRKFRHTDLAGRFFGKTGTLQGVSSLSGYLFPKNSQGEVPYVFAFIVNGSGPQFWKMKEFCQNTLQILMDGKQY